MSETNALIVPDPSVGNVPVGWMQEYALPVISDAGWDELDEIEASILGMASYIEAMGGDKTEYFKALRVVECRRGVLLGPDVKKGERTDLRNDAKVDVHKDAASRYRTLARWWDDLLWPHVLKADKWFQVTQSALLKLARQAELKAHPVVYPEGKYGAVVIDPPWQVKKIARDARPHQTASTTLDYPTLTEDEIVAHVSGIDPFADDCHVWLWTTHKYLPAAFRILEAWRLKYVCTFAWHKPGGFQPVGLPQYNCEFALYARKGSPAFVDTKNFPVCFTAPRGEHSEKPELFYDTVRRVTEGSRLDMFNRREIEGFAQHGNEAGVAG